MEAQSPPRPKPRRPRNQFNPHQSYTQSQSLRPGVLVETSQPFHSNNNSEMLKWIFGKKLGGNEQIKEINVSSDRARATVEVFDIEVLKQLLPNCADICDPISKQPLNIIPVDIATLCLKVTGYPPFVDDATLKTHFEGEANGQQVHFVVLSEDFATIFFLCPTVVLSFLTTTELFGVNLHLELSYNRLDIHHGQFSSQTATLPLTLCVQGLPENMLDKKQLLSQALELYFKQCTGYDVSNCLFEHESGFLTFTNPSAVQAILRNPPTKTFMSGNVLKMSQVSDTLTTLGQIPPSAPRQAWASPPTSSIQIPENTHPVPAQPVPRQRHFSNGSTHNSPPGAYYPWQDQEKSPPQIFPRQTQPFYRNSSGMHYNPSTSTPGPLPQQQTPYLETGYPPYSGEVQRRHKQATDMPFGLHVQDQNEAAKMPLSAPTRPNISCSKIQVMIGDLPKAAQTSSILKLHFRRHVGQISNVELYGDIAIVTLETPTYWEHLLQLSNSNPLEGVVLKVSPLEPSDTVLLTATGNESDPETSKILLIKMILADCIKENDPIKSVTPLSQTKSLVSLNSWQSAQKLVSTAEIETEGLTLSFKEYYSFMDSNKPHSAITQDDPSSQKEKVQEVLNSQRMSLTKGEHCYLKNTLPKLNSKLVPLKAHAEIEEGELECVVIISPVEGSASIDDWANKVIAIQMEHFENLSVETIKFPNKEAKADIQDLLYKYQAITLIERHKDLLVIAGSKEEVAQVCEETTEICLQYTVTTDELDLSKKYVKYLHKFYYEALKKEVVNGKDVRSIQINPDTGSITIKANPSGQEVAKRKIAEIQSSAEEVVIHINPLTHTLLSSRRGAEKLNEILGVLRAQIVYDFEQAQTPDGVQCHICFLSKEKAVLKNVKQNVEKYVCTVSLSTTTAKIRVCSSKEWRDLIATLCEEHFVSVSAIEDSQKIIVTGEQLACNDIVQKVQTFLAKHTNVEERIPVGKSEWFVISRNFQNKISAINDRAKLESVQIKWPNPNSKDSSLPIIISGEPDSVDNIKVMVCALLKNVCKKESRITNVPSVEHVLKSMEDKLFLFETVDKVKVEVTLENENNPEVEAIGGTEMCAQQLCAAVSPSGIPLSICTGDITQNAPVGVIVNFILSSPNPHEGCLNHLLECGGPEVMKDFKQKVSDSMELKPPVKLLTEHGRLKCTQLVHYVLPSWKDGSENDETKEYFVEKALISAFKSAASFGSILITPLTLAPFHYPLNKFVKLVLHAVSALSSHLQVVVYVEDIGHANEFQSAFITRNFHVHQKISVDASLVATNGKPDLATTLATASKTKTISNLNSFITLVNGDLLEQQVDVYINSTNSELNLKNGQVSRLLLNICGEELQKEASEYAPLKWGQIAVTNGKNLKCTKIYHIQLPEYKMANSERIFRDTVKQIFRVARSNSVSSIAIPSLGVANLGYPESVSAGILFQEIIAFHSQYPNSIQKYVLVIYDKNVFQAFSKEFVQQLSGQTTLPQAQPQPPPAGAEAATSAGAGTTIFSIVQGNIAEETSDIIVNTASKDMILTKTAVSKAILKKAGDQLQKTCKQYVENGMVLDHGQILTTPSFGKLRCKKIIHAYLPPKGSMTTSSTDHGQLIKKIVSDCLQRAEKENMTSISFPAFGLGGGGYTVEDIAEPMLNAFQAFVQSHPKFVKSVRVVIYDRDLHEKFEKFYHQFFGLRDSDPTSQSSWWQRLLPVASHKPKRQELQMSMITGQSLNASGWQSMANSTVIFTIFSASDDKCKEIATKLRQLVSEKSTTRKISDQFIEKLLDEDIADINQIGRKMGVQVEIVQKIKEIHVSGEKSKVIEAERDIEKVLNCTQQTMTNLVTVKWKSEDDDGTYESYPFEASVRLERAFNKKPMPNTIELTVDGILVEIDLHKNEETNKVTRTKRKIKRSKESVQAYPPIWETLRSGKTEKMTMIEVPKGTQEHAVAVKEFEESLVKVKSSFSIEKVQRIENKIEYGRHMAFHRAIRDKHKKEPLVKRLFHGSKQENLELIAVRGFNRNFASDANGDTMKLELTKKEQIKKNAAFFGKGVYCAVEASYSAQVKYAAPDSSGLQHMFVCRMIVGEYTLGKQDMKMAPSLSTDSTEVFDSLVDNVDAPTIFVAMTDAQVYPEYLITFKKLK